MNTIRTFAFSLIAAMTAMISMARAEVASGTYTMDFANTTALWDVSGTYSANVDGLTIDYTMSVDPGGKITGKGSADYRMSGIGGINSDFTFTGTVKSSGNVTRVTMNWKMSGTGTLSGQPFKFGTNLKVNLEIDHSQLVMVGTVGGKITVSAAGVGNYSETIPPTTMELDLPDKMDGTWKLGMVLATVASKTSGTGTIILSNGSKHYMTATGSYKPTTNRTKLTFKGLPTNRAMSATTEATFFPASPGYEKGVRCESLKGKALGQSLLYSDGL